MPKDLPAQVITQMDASQKRPVLLFELGLGSTVRFAAHKSNVVFPTAGNTYTAKTIQLGKAGSSLEGQIQRITVKFDNVSQDMAAYANNEDFRGKSLIIKRIYLDEVGSATYYNEVFNGLMERPTSISRYFMTVPATIGKPLDQRSLKVAYQRMCPWVFGGTECNTDGYADLTTLKVASTADSGTTSTLVDNALNQIDNYWNYGEIEIIKSGVTYNRKVKDFVAATDTITLDVELPVAINNTCTYTVYKGCDQSHDACGSTHNYGPSANNRNNFGGCIHIGKPPASESTILPASAYLPWDQSKYAPPPPDDPYWDQHPNAPRPTTSFLPWDQSKYPPPT